jgi:hypothetical protein
MLTVGAGVASLSVFSATTAGADSSSTSNSNNNNDNTTQSNSASTSGACSPVQQQNNRSIDNSNDVRGGDGGDGGKGGNGANPRRVMLEAAAKPGQGNANIPILSPGTGNGNGSGGDGGNGGNGGPAHGSANAGNQVQVVSNCGNTTVNPVRTVVVTRTVTVQAGAARAVTSTAHFTG